jgi:phosphatidylglycerol:prolipoprotein diacylglycerol transferase
MIEGVGHFSSLLLGLATSFGLIWVAWRSPSKQALFYVDAGIIVLLGGFLGGRAAYIAVNWVYYRAHPLEVFQVWSGGFSASGALIGIIVALTCFALFTRHSLGKLADSLLPLAALLSTAAWVACWIEGSAYGPVSDAWWALPTRDEWGRMLPRLPIQLIGLLLTLSLYWAIDRFESRLSTIPGLSALLAWLGLTLELLVLSYFRVDPVPVWRGLRLDTWGALALVLLAIISLILLVLRKIRSA